VVKLVETDRDYRFPYPSVLILCFDVVIGTAYTLLHSEHVHHFKELIQKTGREKIPKHAVKDKELQPLMDKYQATLEKLEEAVKREKQTSQQGSRLKGQEEIEKCLKQQLMKNIKA